MAMISTVDNDVDSFARWHVESGDIDPAYPVLACINDELGLDADERAALALLYVAYYNLPSALRAWLDGWRPGDLLTVDQMRYGTGVERRAHRSVAAFQLHLRSLNKWIDYWGGADRLLDPPIVEPRRRWNSLQRRLSAIHGNGRWAGYKMGEIADTVLDYRCPPPDAGHASSSGPRKGLADIYPEAAHLTGNTPTVVARLDDLTETLVDRWALPVAQVETVLCDWHSTVKGHYYIGHDLDLEQERIARCGDRRTAKLLTNARWSCFDERWLGEAGGWRGVRSDLKRLYQRDRILEWW